ncbi:MAG TPA: NADPH:quinone oxidoreductase family protein, partial [Paracoccaceae bacterium]|nr:NADPH:quinone oxidoreductase family protein [Paracoccaceae bacterium]
MRALVVEEYGPYDSHRLHEDWPEPEPGPGEVLIETRAMSVNFPDVLMVEGGYQHRPTPPVVAGFDVSGVVAAVGEGVTRAAVGDRVLAYVADGAFAERVAAPEGDVWRMPDEMPFEHGAAFGLVYLTAHASLVENCRAEPGEWVLVTGASGGVGLAMVQYGRALGLRVIGGVTSPEKAALVREHGAEATVDLAAPNLHESLREQVRAIAPEGVDLVLDQVGGDVFDACLRCIRPCGRIAIVGFAGGRIHPIKPTYLLNKQITVIGSPLGKIRPDWQEVKDRAMAA